MAEDLLREQIKFAATCQPGEECPAINGDAYAIQSLAFFARKVPPDWLDDICNQLYRDHEGKWEDCDGNQVDSIKGVGMLSFHEWVAGRIIKVVGRFNHGGHYSGRGSNARAMQASITKWALTEKESPKKQEDQEIVVENVNA